MTLTRTLLRRPAALMLSLAAVAAVPASAHAANDQWTHWVSDKLQSDIHSIDFTTPATMFAGSYGDGIFNSFTSQTGPWTLQNSGIAPADLQINQVYTSGPNVFAASTGGLYRGTDPTTGGTWTKLAQTPGAPNQLFQSINSVIVTGNRIVVAAVSSGFWYSDDGGSNWFKAGGTQPSETPFHIISVGPALVAGSSSGVYVSFDQGSSWVLRSDGLPFANILRVAVDPTNALRMYALAGSEVYKVDLDALAKGALWTEASGAGPVGTQFSAGSLPKATSLTIAPDGYGSGKVFVGTDNGVFATTDGGTSWGQMTGNTVSADTVDNMDQQKVLALGLGFPIGQTQDLNLLAGTPHGLFWLTMAPLAKANGKNDVGAVQADATPHPGDIVQAPADATIAQSFTGSRPLIFTFVWKRCTGKNASSIGTGCSTIPGETGRQYVVKPGTPSNGDQGDYIGVEVTATNIVSKNSIVMPSKVTTNKVAAPVGSEPIVKSPANTNGPQITPTASQVYGATYSVSHGTWVRGDTATALTGTTSYKYRWQRCLYDPPYTCTDIPGTTSSTTSYKSTPDDIGSNLKVAVTIVNSDYGSSTLETATQSIYGKPADKLQDPKVVGDPYIGETVSSSVGEWNGQHVTFTRQWKRCDPDGTHCVSIINATDPDYKVQAQDRGYSLKIGVQSDDQDQFSHRYADAESTQTAVVGDRPVVTPPAGTPPGGTPPAGNPPGVAVIVPKTLGLTIPKKLKVGTSLAAPKTVKGFVKVAYQWQRNKKNIKKATKRTYKLSIKDRGKAIRCRITLTDAAGKKHVVYSKTLKVSKKLRRR